jgi:hypothetical protein
LELGFGQGHPTLSAARSSNHPARVMISITEDSGKRQAASLNYAIFTIIANFMLDDHRNDQ